MEYMIVKGGSALGLESNVREQLLLGWKPVGGVAVDSSDNFYQVMTLGIWVKAAATRPT
jgi:hypothetical protein